MDTATSSSRDRTEAEREQESRDRERARRRALRETAGDWDRYFRRLLEIERGFLIDLVGQGIAEAVAEARTDLEKKMAVSLRIAILEQAGLCPRIKGTWNPDESYSALDVVAKDGSTFICKRTGAGQCPGEDWQIMATRGERGRPGERGPQGERGPPGPRGEIGAKITGWSVDPKSFTVRPILDGGKGGYGPVLDLRALFLEFQCQASSEAAPAPAASNSRPQGHGPPLVHLIDGGKPQPPAACAIAVDEPVLP